MRAKIGARIWYQERKGAHSIPGKILEVDPRRKRDGKVLEGWAEVYLEGYGYSGGIYNESKRAEAEARLRERGVLLEGESLPIITGRRDATVAEEVA